MLSPRISLSTSRTSCEAPSSPPAERTPVSGNTASLPVSRMRAAREALASSRMRMQVLRQTAAQLQTHCRAQLEEARVLRHEIAGRMRANLVNGGLGYDCSSSGTGGAVGAKLVSSNSALR
jgi:hypothetical protein